MALLKKILFGLFVVSALVFAVWAYFNLKNSKKPTVKALSVLPDNCLVYLNTNDFFALNKKINSQSLIADKLKLFGDVNLFCNTLHSFDSLFTANSLLEEMVKKGSIHFALYENLNWVAAFNIKRLGNQELITSELAKMLTAQKAENNTYTFTLNKKDKFYFTLNSGVAIISNNPTTIDLALNNTTVKLEKNSSFLAFKNTFEENSLLSIYLNHKLYAKSKAATKLNLTLACKTGYSSGSFNIEPSQLTLNGYLKPDTTEIISAFYDQEPQSPDFLNFLPNNTSSFKAYGFSSFENLNTTVNKKSGNPNSKFWKLVTDTALFNIEKEFYQNAQNYLVNFESKIPGEKFALLKIVDTTKAIEHLGFMSDSLISDDSIFIYKLKSKGIKQPLKLFDSFLKAVTNYAALYQSHLIFSENKEELIRLIVDLKNETTVTKNESFIVYKNQNLSEDFNYLVYNMPNKYKREISSFFNFELKDQKNPFENFKHFSFSLTNNKNNFKFRWQLMNEAEMVNKEQNVLWTLNLDAPSTMQASGFVNHITKENELAIQDETKMFYLINAKGTILWQKKLNEKITSKIFTVDIFKNNKYQLLFSSENYLHLIDRNGNYVQGYPVKLPAAASSELSVLDYDNDKDYRLLIACKNNMIYNYSIFGVKVDKFTAIKTDAEVMLPVQYAKVGLSDYLITADKEGKIYTFSRKGEARIGLKNKTIENCSAFYVDATNNINSTYLIYIDDKNNLINKISFSDKKVIEKLSSDLEPATVKFSNVDDNKAMDVIITKPNTVLAYNLNGNLLFEKTIESELSETNFYSDESHSLFLLFSNTKQELILLDQLKQKLKSIHATAQPLISNLFNNNKKYLIVTDGERLNCVAL
ncbi:MAG: hypothetical protein Q8L81_09495 [Bacteroidota bacterium]|nr:hypothetical protein [Bacteroidota bacterium]